MRIYSNTAGENIIKKYIDKGGELQVFEEGCLLCYGLAICSGEGLKFCILKEKYLNSWSSAYTIQLFNRLPKKYQKLVPLE